MRSLLREQRRDLLTFLDQRDDLALVVACRPRETVWLSRMLDEIDWNESPDLFFVIVEDLHRPDVFVDRVVAAFLERHAEIVRAQTERGVPAWPPVPASLVDSALGEVERMRALVAFTRTLVADDHRVVWALLPMRITDWGAWGSFIAEVMAHTLPFPWCAGVRFILRDDPNNAVLGRRLGTTSAIRFGALVVDNARLRRSLLDGILDRAESLEERIADLLALSMVDASEGRFDQALEGYRVARRFYDHTLDVEMVAVADVLVAAVHLTLGDRDRATALLEAACAAAIDAGAGWLVPTIAGALAEIAVGREEWQRAEGFFAATAEFASAALDLRRRVEALTVLGTCRFMRHRFDQATDAWTRAAESARMTGDQALIRPVLQRLREHYRQRGDEQEHAEIERELATFA